MPTHNYIDFYAGYLNKLVLLSVDSDCFSQFLRECYPEASEKDIENAKKVRFYNFNKSQAIYRYKLHNFFQYLFMSMNATQEHPFHLNNVPDGEGICVIMQSADRMFNIKNKIHACPWLIIQHLVKQLKVIKPKYINILPLTL